MAQEPGIPIAFLTCYRTDTRGLSTSVIRASFHPFRSAMAAPPSPAVLAAMATVGDVFDWVPIKDAFRDAVCTELGVAVGDPVRTLANVEEGDLNDAKKTIKIGDRALNAAKRGKVGSAWRTSRLAAELQKTTAETETEKKEATTAAK